jgi:hypothetical protein
MTNVKNKVRQELQAYGKKFRWRLKYTSPQMSK